MDGTITFSGFKSYVEKYGFFGTSAKRDDDLVSYNFKSYMYTKISLSIKTRKLDAKSIPSPKIVAEILVNGVECDSWSFFIKTLKELTRYNGTKKYKKDYRCHKLDYNLNRNDAKSVRVLRKETL